MYQIRILNNSRELQAVLDIPSWRYTRRPSEATEISVTIPQREIRRSLTPDEPIYGFLAPQQPAYSEATDTAEYKGQYAQVAAFVQVFKDTVLRASGRISNRSISDTSVSLKCHTEEILLERHQTPAQYGRAFDNLDLADLARMILDGWYSQRVKARSQWDAAIEKSNVDTSTQPGVVMLAKDVNGAYQASGYITLRFAAADVPEFKSWDRIRWVSDNGDIIRTTMQYRYGPDSANMGAWSDEYVGALPDTLGIVPGTTDAPLIDVRINLYTDDTTTADASGTPVGQTPFVFAVELISRTHGSVSAGSIPSSAGVTVRGLTADHDTAFKVLRDACSQAGWEFEVIDGQLNIAEKLGYDRTNDFVLRKGTNMSITALGDEDSEMVNILTAYGPGEGINRMQVILRDETSINNYGPYPKSKEFSGAVDLADLEAQAQTWLSASNTPKQTFSVRAKFDPDEEPHFEIGDLVKVVDPDTGVVTTARIMEETRSYSKDGVTIDLQLNKPKPSFVDSVLGIIGEDEPPSQLPLSPPIGLRAETAVPGVEVFVNPFANSRSVGVEIHGSNVAGFTPSTATLLDKGQKTRFRFDRLPPNERWYFRARSYDAAGYYSDFTDEVSAVSGELDLTLDDSLFAIQPSSDPAPLSGDLTSLWDGDETTGVEFASGPVTITFSYPVEQGSDMIRCHLGAGTFGYVQMKRAEIDTWVNVLGSAASPVYFGQGYNIKRFTDNKLYFGKEYRLVLNDPVRVNELKFWRVTLADEILARVMTLTNELTIRNSSGEVWMDEEGIKMKAAASQYLMAAFLSKALKFWDPTTGNPAIGLGDVADWATTYGSDMAYGFLMLLGEIRASEAVLRQSLTDLGTSSDKIGLGAILEDRIGWGAVTIARLNEWLQVPDTTKQTLLRDSWGTFSRNGQSWVGPTVYTIGSVTFEKRDDVNGFLAEQVRVTFDPYFEIKTNSNWSTIRVYLSLYMGDTEIFIRDYAFPYTTSDVQVQNDHVEITMDARNWAQSTTFTWKAYLTHNNYNLTVSGSDIQKVEVRNCSSYQNEQLPVRWGKPQYTVGTGASGCYANCEITCQTGCEVTCEDSCQVTCEATCESTCQSTCETTSQGGGCLRDGTPVTVWDEAAQEYREIPVEQLEPGMILPRYDMATGEMIKGTLLELRDARYSVKFFRIHTDNGPSIDVTGEQPFDVLATLRPEEGEKPFQLQARYLRPGMKMIRPFENREAVITEVELVKPGKLTHFWNPITDTRGYIVAGYADVNSKV